MFLVTLLLVYTGTIFLYRLCFLDFRLVPANATRVTTADDPTWRDFDMVVTVIFWVDLVANFFFSYDDGRGNEVLDLRLVSRHYLQSHFAINLIACIPEELITAVISLLTDTPDAGGSVNQGVRMLRLQRVSRLARLMRLSRLGKLKAQKSSHWYRWLQRQKSARVLNLAGGLTWVVHILACGWYLCAALHDDPEKTWVARRIVDVDESGAEVPLIDQGAFDQWLTAMYFILTVFTTVGFGDMSAGTLGEIVYVCFTMGVGAVVHSIVISEVISAVTSVDQMNDFVNKQKELMESFVAHTELDEAAEVSLKHWIDCTAREWFTTRYDRDAMAELVMGDSMPRDLLGRLPASLFKGQLLQHRFLRICEGVCSVPPRLPVLVALAVHPSHFDEYEIVYAAQDYPFSMFLVLRGTFAFVARPSDTGGIVDTPKSSRPSYRSPSKRSRPSLRLPMVARPSPRQEAAMCADDSMRSHASTSSQDPAKELRPYVLFSSGAYFGECELVRTQPRKATARCESEGGEVLTMGREDFKRLSDQFPQFGAKWEELAAKRERRRARKQFEFTSGGSHKHLAVLTIQQWCRRVTARPDDPSESPFQRRVRKLGGMKEFARRLLSKPQGEDESLNALEDRQARVEQQLETLSRHMSSLMERVHIIAEATTAAKPRLAS